MICLTVGAKFHNLGGESKTHSGANTKLILPDK